MTPYKMPSQRSSKIRLPLLILFFLTSSLALYAANNELRVYFGTYTTGKSQGIYLSHMDASGKISAPELVATTKNPSFIATDSKQNFLYCINEVGGVAGKKQADVTSYSIEPSSGKLNLLNQQPSGSESLCHVSVSSDDKTLLVASYGGGSVTAFPLNADGTLGKPSCFIQHELPDAGSTNHKSPHAHCLLTDPTGRFALACDLGLDRVFVYGVNPSKSTLTPNVPPYAMLKAGYGPRHLAFSRDSKFVYVINELNCSVTVFGYDGSLGNLSEIQTISTLPPGVEMKPSLSGAEIVAHPDGKFIYTTTRGCDMVHVFSIDQATGKLSRVEDVPSGGKTPRNFNIDPTGRFLIAANQNSDNVTIFQIDPATGHLTPTGQSVEIGNPTCVLFVQEK